MRFFVLVVFFFFIGAFAQDEASNARLRSISNNLNLDPSVVLAFCLVLVVLVGFVVWYEINKSNKEHRVKLSAQWKSFQSQAVERGIPGEMLRLLAAIMRCSDRFPPDSAFHSPVAYENALDAYLRKRKTELGEKEYKELRQLRILLGYHHLHPEAHYVSTRQLRVGDRINMRMTLSHGEEGRRVFESGVLEVWEDRWEIENRFGKILPLTDLNMSLTRPGDADYLLTASVTSVTETRIILGHTNNLIRKQQRSWVRLDVQRDIVVVVSSTNADGASSQITHRGTTIDISGGGLSLQIPARLELGTEVELTFSLSSHYSGIQAVVRRVGELHPGELCRHSLEFVDLKDVVREQIVRFIFEEQRSVAKHRMPYGTEESLR